MTKTKQNKRAENRTSMRWTIPLLMYFISISLGAFSKTTNKNKIDSLQTVLTTASGNEKISTQLDLALLLIDNNIPEAKLLANSALQYGLHNNNKNLEIRSFYVLGRLFYQIDSLKLAQSYFNSALDIAETIDDNWHKGELLYRIGALQHHSGNDLKALETFNASIQASRLSKNFRSLGASYSLMGIIFRMNGLYDRAIEYIIKAKLNYEKAMFDEGGAWSSYLLGLTYIDLKLYHQAENYFLESLQVYSRLAAIDGNQDGLGICYAQLGVLKMLTEDYEEARKNINQALKIYSEKQSKFGLASVYTTLGILEYNTENYELAKEYLNKSLQLKIETKNILGYATVYEYLGLCMIKTGQTKEGIKTVQKGLHFSIEKNQKKVQLDIYSRLTETYLSLNDLNAAVACQTKQIEIQNHMLSGGANIKIEQLQAIYEIDEKNNQIAELEKQNQINALTIKQNRTVRNGMILSIVLVFLVLAVIYWSYTKLRRINHELKETNASKDKFFAIIAHDLRGPTGALTGVLKHLNSSFDEFNKAELKELMHILHNSAENVNNLLENLLLWAQSQVRNMDYKPTQIPLSEMILSAQKGAEQSANNKEISIQLESNDEIVVNADPNMAQTILRNILGNAIKFSYRGGKVIIRSQLKDKNTALVQIIDKGVGIDKSNLSKLFDITSSHHTKGTENEQSTGLGLILVKEFVEKNNGTVAIESEKKKGTTVSFTLPVV